MSLRAFHIIFIILAIVMAAGCSAWAFINGVSVIFGAGSALVAVGLIIYGIWFVIKSRNIII